MSPIHYERPSTYISTKQALADAEVEAGETNAGDSVLDYMDRGREECVEEETVNDRSEEAAEQDELKENGH